jgi:L-malate glycosyltransferase
VDVLGQLSPEQVADEMRRAHALLHASDYETYSAVCAEALCCGTPVIASRVGGIVEYMNTARGAMIAEATAQAWANGIRTNWQRCLDTDRTAIAAGMAERAGSRSVGPRYAAILREITETQHTR